MEFFHFNKKPSEINNQSCTGEEGQDSENAIPFNRPPPKTEDSDNRNKNKKNVKNAKRHRALT